MASSSRRNSQPVNSISSTKYFVRKRSEGIFLGSGGVTSSNNAANSRSPHQIRRRNDSARTTSASAFLASGPSGLSATATGYNQFDSASPSMPHRQQSSPRHHSDSIPLITTESPHQDATLQGTSAAQDHTACFVGYDQFDGASLSGSGSGVGSGVGLSRNVADIERHRGRVDELQQKIELVKEKLKAEQQSMNDYLEEYLGQTNQFGPIVSPDNAQLIRIRQAFERRNNKIKQNQAFLQKKLEEYEKRLRDLEDAGPVNAPAQKKHPIVNVGQNLKDVGANIKDSITETVMSVPKDLANRIIGSGRERFGSADNIPQEFKDGDDLLQPSPANPRQKAARSVADGSSSVFYTDFDPVHNGTGTNGRQHLLPDAPQSGSDRGITATMSPRNGTILPQEYVSESPATTTDRNIERVLKLLEKYERLHEDLAVKVEKLREKNWNDYSGLHTLLHEQTAKLELFSQEMNDKVDLHATALNKIKDDIAATQDSLDYQMDYKIGELKDPIEGLTARISKLEHAQQSQISFESLSQGSSQNVLVLKAVNILILVLQFCLVLVSTLAQITTPFLKTRIRLIATVLVVVVITYLYGNRSMIFALFDRTKK